MRGVARVVRCTIQRLSVLRARTPLRCIARCGRASVKGIALRLAAALAGTLVAACTAEAPRSPVVLAATHTLEDAGLLDTLAAAFRTGHPEIALRVVVSGSGEALEYARSGSVDVVLTHAPEAEMDAVRRNDVQDRRVLMQNAFLIAGPPDDPAGIAGMTDAAAALVRIAGTGARIVSRDDRSGTNLRELALWQEAGRGPPAGNAYVRAGVGMADALRIADARGAYILTDPATFAMLKDELTLVPLVNGDPRLTNTYSVMRATKAPNPENARILMEWLMGPTAGQIITGYQVERGVPLFSRAREGREKGEGRDGS